PLSGVRSNQLSYRPATTIRSCSRCGDDHPNAKRGETLVSPRSNLWEPVSPDSAYCRMIIVNLLSSMECQSLRTKQWVSTSRDASKGSLRLHRERIDLGKSTSARDAFLRKEVIQPHLPIRLP